MDNKKIVFATGGTLGHLLPAILVAKQIVSLHKNVEIFFLGSGRPLEEKLLQNEPFTYLVLRSQGVRRLGITGLVKFLFLLPASFYSAYKTIKMIRPDIIVGFGSYISFLPIIVGKMQKIKTHIHEAEKSAGLTNRILSLFVDSISCAYSEYKNIYGKNVTVTGQPIKEEFLTVKADRKLKQSLEKTLLILGGSQGAKKIDELLLKSIDIIKSLNIKVVHQCTKHLYKLLDESYSKASIDYQLTYFIDDMPKALLECTWVVSRAGAGAIRELTFVEVPTLLVPLPAEEQQLNAKLMEHCGIAVVADEDNVCEFQEKLTQLISCGEKWKISNVNYSQSIEEVTLPQKLIAVEIIDIL